LFVCGTVSAGAQAVALQDPVRSPTFLHLLHASWHQDGGASLPDIAAELGERLADPDAALATAAAALELVCWALQRAEALDQVRLCCQLGSTQD
jgi:hypothetical protein